MKKLVLILCWSCYAQAQPTLPPDSLAPRPASDRFRPTHRLLAGVKLPLNYTAGYQFRFTRRVSVQAEGGLIAPPFDRSTLRTLDVFGLDASLSRALDRSFRSGRLASIGVTLHANSPWYAGVFGQYVALSAGPITPADGLGVYFKQDFSGFGLLDSPTFVFTLQSALGLAGLRLGRSFGFRDSRWGLNAEASLGKIISTRNRFSSNRSLIDGLGVTQRLYQRLDDELDTNLRQKGYLPTLTVLLTYRLAGTPR